MKHIPRTIHFEEIEVTGPSSCFLWNVLTSVQNAVHETPFLGHVLTEQRKSELVDLSVFDRR